MSSWLALQTSLAAPFSPSALTAQGGILASPQCIDTLLVDIETHHRAFLTEFDGKWQADIAKTDNSEFYFLQAEHMKRPSKRKLLI